MVSTRKDRQVKNIKHLDEARVRQVMLSQIDMLLLTLPKPRLRHIFKLSAKEARGDFTWKLHSK